MSARHNGVIGIEIGEGIIAAAQYSVQEDAITGSVVRHFGDPRSKSLDESLTRELKKILSAFKKKKCSIAFSLPAESAIVRKILIDSDEPAVEEAIVWELKAQSIGPIEEYSYDYQPLARGSGAQGEHAYLAAAYCSAAIQKQLSLFKSVKLFPAVADLDIFALSNVFEVNYPEEFASRAVLLLGSRKGSKAILISGGTFLDFAAFSHEMAPPPATDYLRRLDECLCTLGLFSDGDLSGVPALYLAGELFADRDFTKSILGRLEKAELLDPFRKVREAPVSGRGDATIDPRLSVAVGLALRGKLK